MVYMNERINELKSLATKWYDENFPELAGYYDNLEWENKFVELIIQDCIGVCEEHKEMYAMLNETAGSDSTFAAMTTSATSCISGIKQHFGVEE